MLAGGSNLSDEPKVVRNRQQAFAGRGVTHQPPSPVFRLLGGCSPARRCHPTECESLACHERLSSDDALALSRSGAR